MTWLSKNGDRRAARPIVPRLESLDERTLPVANFLVSNGTLFINAPKAQFGPGLNRIVVTDNGGTGTNNVTVQSNDRTFRPNVAISNVVIRGRAGVENVTYNMTGSLVGGRSILVGLGGNSDSFDLTVRRDFTNGSTLSVVALGGAGDDRIRTTLIGNMNLASDFNYCGEGNAGNDELSFRTTSAVAIGTSSRLSLVQNGAGGSDNIQTEYNGVLNGTLGFQNSGGGKEDQIRALVTVFSNSTGLLDPSRVLGDGGNDDLRFVVRNNSNVAVTFNQILDGGNGTNKCVRTNDVIGTRCQNDQVI